MEETNSAFLHGHRNTECLYVWHGGSNHPLSLNEGRMWDWSAETELDGEHKFDPNNFYKKNIRRQIGNYSPLESNLELAKEHKKSRTLEDRNALGNYISKGLNFGHDTGSSELNKHLINQYKENKPKPTNFTYVPKGHCYMENSETMDLHHLDNAIRKNKLKAPLTTYSGIGFDPAEHNTDNIMHFPAYTSGSLNRAVSTKYTKPNNRHILQIDHKIGHTGAYIGNDSDISPFNDDEFIMPRNIKVKIHHTPEEHEDTDGTKFKIWKATRI